MKIFSVFTSKLFAGASLVLLLLCAALWMRSNHYEHKAESLELAYEAQRAEFLAKTQEAEAMAEAQRMRIENAYDAAARRADNATAEAERLRALADKYARANRVRAKTVEDRGRRAETGEGDPARDRDEPGDDAEFLAVTRNDFDILIENSIRLNRVREWGEDLIERKLAIPDVEFGKTQGD